MYNIVLYFENVSLQGLLRPLLPRSRFSIISDNKLSTSAQVIPNCELQRGWNAWLCETNKIGVMIFDSLDDDRMDRAVQPVYI